MENITESTKLTNEFVDGLNSGNLEEDLKKLAATAVSPNASQEQVAYSAFDAFKNAENVTVVRFEAQRKPFFTTGDKVLLGLTAGSLLASAILRGIGIAAEKRHHEETIKRLEAQNSELRDVVNQVNDLFRAIECDIWDLENTGIPADDEPLDDESIEIFDQEPVAEAESESDNG